MVVESPTKAKSIGKYLGRGFDVKATIGHLRDLPTRKLGVDVDNGFQPEVRHHQRQDQDPARAEAAPPRRRAPSISRPTPTGRARRSRGTWPTSSSTRRRLHRVLFHEITKDAVQEAMAEAAASSTTTR